MNENIWKDHNACMRVAKNLRAGALRARRQGNLKLAQTKFHKAAAYDRRAIQILIR